jgi:hypothetical protein
MKTAQHLWTPQQGWEALPTHEKPSAPQLVLVFGNRAKLAAADWADELEVAYPDAAIVACSTAGEIVDVEVHDQALVATAVQFETAEVRLARIALAGHTSEQAGRLLAEQLLGDGLRHVIVLSDGLKVNGTELIRGLAHALPEGVSMTGGLAGDGADFKETCVGIGPAPQPGELVGIGLYGSGLRVGYGSVGGWDPFGPDRQVTRSEANVLYELDGKPALELYKSYLGDKASGLPASALLFPLSMRTGTADEDEVVRTVLAVDEATQSMTFAGDIPQGSLVRLMKANFDRLVDGAQHAAHNSLSVIGSFQPRLALLISCVGRKLVLGPRVEDEIEAVREAIGGDVDITGFYSYGEIAPGKRLLDCKLHNQTMTITLLGESV